MAVDDDQKVSNCINIPSSQTFRSYLCRLTNDTQNLKLETVRRYAYQQLCIQARLSGVTHLPEHCVIRH
jgi:hypothetical protein